MVSWTFALEHMVKPQHYRWISQYPHKLQMHVTAICVNIDVKGTMSKKEVRRTPGLWTTRHMDPSFEDLLFPSSGDRKFGKSGRQCSDGLMLSQARELTELSDPLSDCILGEGFSQLLSTYVLGRLRLFS